MVFKYRQNPNIWAVNNSKCTQKCTEQMSSCSKKTPNGILNNVDKKWHWGVFKRRWKKHLGDWLNKSETVSLRDIGGWTNPGTDGILSALRRQHTTADDELTVLRMTDLNLATIIVTQQSETGLIATERYISACYFHCVLYDPRDARWSTPSVKCNYSQNIASL